MSMSVLVTDKQYRFFLYLYEQEQKRYERLEARAKTYFAIVGLYLGGLTIALRNSRNMVPSFGEVGLMSLVLGVL